MRSGRYEAAWTIAEASMRARDPATRDQAGRPYHERWVWDGRSFDDRHVLVRCYHGLGDTIQFARYLPLLARRAASVTLEVQPSLITLLQSVPGVDRFVPFDPARPSPPSECDIEITELDFALRAPPPPPAPVQATRALLPAGTIALCHGSGDWDGERDIPAALLQPICDASPCVTLVPGPSSLDVLNPDGCPMDMAVTASLIAGASLVVTVDTMVAHLAGSLGTPTWLLLKAEPDWRWSPRERFTVWYPRMRLYAQPRAGDWPSVIHRVMVDLAVRTGMSVEN